MNRRAGTLRRPDWGHADAPEGGHYPDQPYHDPTSALTAIETMYNTFSHLAAQRGKAPTLDWDELRSRVLGILETEADMAGRERLWRGLIQEYFQEDVRYEDIQAPEAWHIVFEARAAEQREFVLGLEGVPNPPFPSIRQIPYPEVIPSDGTITITGEREPFIDGWGRRIE